MFHIFCGYRIVAQIVQDIDELAILLPKILSNSYGISRFLDHTRLEEMDISVVLTQHGPFRILYHRG